MHKQQVDQKAYSIDAACYLMSQIINIQEFVYLGIHRVHMPLFCTTVHESKPTPNTSRKTLDINLELPCLTKELIKPVLKSLQCRRRSIRMLRVPTYPAKSLLLQAVRISLILESCEGLLREHCAICNAP